MLLSRVAVQQLLMVPCAAVQDRSTVAWNVLHAAVQEHMVRLCSNGARCPAIAGIGLESLLRGGQPLGHNHNFPDADTCCCPEVTAHCELNDT